MSLTSPAAKLLEAPAGAMWASKLLLLLLRRMAGLGIADTPAACD
jgi:hypothetical protein